jgi:HEAT repeat protein/PBS lyase HEAT-like repeat-containing protein
VYSKPRDSGVVREAVLVSPKAPAFPANLCSSAGASSDLMDYSATFARHFARLVSLLMHDVGNVDEQKVSLRALVTVSKSDPITMVARDWQLVVNDQPVPGALTGVQDVAGQMGAHSILSVRIAEGASAADLLGLARIIAAGARAGDGGALAKRKLAGLAAKGILLQTAEPEPAPTVAEAPTLIVAAESPSARPENAPASRPVHEGPTIISQLAGADVTKLTPEQLFAMLDSTRSADDCTKVLDDLVLLAENCVRVGKPGAVGDIFYGIVSRDAGVSPSDAEIKRAYVMAIRRMAKPALLRGVATLIPKKPERRQHYYEVLERTGEDGADAVIEQISQAPTNEDRRTLFEVLQELQSAVPALKRMLGDSRWFVVRNAADLLGEMAATQAESELVALLRHSDDRVRRSATNALLRLGTPEALKGIYEAVNDKSPEVRMHAAVAIATRKDGRTSGTLIRAIEDEQDGDVQLAMIAALGKVGTPDAVQKLVKMAEAEGRLFKKKTPALRVAAVQALGEAKTPAALNALKELTGDKDRDVRDTATRALAHASR